MEVEVAVELEHLVLAYPVLSAQDLVAAEQVV
jgi:hypothetical protein